MAGTKRARAAGPGLFAADEPDLGVARVARVALNRPVRREFTYLVPDELAARVVPGVRVAVDFGGLRELGVVVDVAEHREGPGEVPRSKLKPLARLLDDEPLVSRELLDLARWIANEYACSWGEALAAILPAALKSEAGHRLVTMVTLADGVGPAELAELEAKHPKQHRLLRTLMDVGGAIELRELSRQLNLSDAPARTLARRGFVRIERVEAVRDALAFAKSSRTRPERLSDRQQIAIDALCASLEKREHRGFLLEGVTGSGKTEVYLTAIERSLALGRSAIVLVPEIALTPQTVGWFRSRFERVAVLHSRMTDLQRLDMWLSIAHGGPLVVVGARSAIFAPVGDLGVVVVDEEHEPSFKQGSAPRYHARDVALERARLANAICVLGSATPSLESWCAAREGRLAHLRLPERASGKPLPPVEVLDLKSERLASTPSRLFSLRLVELLRGALARKEQSILFLNRRGFAPVLWCSGCKQTVRCKRCDVTLVFHRRIQRLVCHLCCEEMAPVQSCPTCTKPKLRYLSAGSERIEQELATLLEGARIQRMDSDTMRRREDYERALDAFGNGEIDVLVGTQMIAKGLDFPRVTVVGIVNADSALYLPDFRASERTFQLIAQVAGRAGRGELPGRIVVQTHSPSHPSIVRAARHDFDGFAKAESELRAELGYPPFGRLLRIFFEDPSEPKVATAARTFAEALRARVDDPKIVLLGPAPAPIAMARGRFRHHLLVKTPRDGAAFAGVRETLCTLVEEAGAPKPTLDVDPVSLL
ncbi:MAG: primosomal protein N' [Planctomycetes bacterium]|nr:primosomal protein N' [Planctomycetota bacterium]